MVGGRELATDDVIFTYSSSFSGGRMTEAHGRSEGDVVEQWI